MWFKKRTTKANAMVKEKPLNINLFKILDMHEVLNLAKRLPGNFKPIGPGMAIPLGNGFDNDVIFAWCHHKIVVPETCGRRSLDTVNKPNSCWDCDMCYVMRMCGNSGDVDCVKEIRKEHTVDLEYYMIGDYLV